MSGLWRMVSAAVMAAAAVATVATADPAHAAVPACGSTITVDTVLTADLSCTGDGLIIGGPNVDLDLAGHTVAGTGSAFGAGGSGTGVRLVPVASGATVRNGRVRGFQVGVEVAQGADGAEVGDLAVVDNGTGIALASSGSWIRDSLVVNNGTAMNLRGSGNEVTGNALRANGSGIAGTGIGLSILANSVSGDGAHDAGVLLIGVQGATVSGNSVSGSGEGAGILIVGSPSVDVTANQVFHNLDGIVVIGGQARLSHNVAFYNADLGIEAPGATDGGGNRAFGNGDPRQCVGVACS